MGSKCTKEPPHAVCGRSGRGHVDPHSPICGCLFFTGALLGVDSKGQPEGKSKSNYAAPLISRLLHGVVYFFGRWHVSSAATAARSGRRGPEMKRKPKTRRETWEGGFGQHSAMHAQRSGIWELMLLIKGTGFIFIIVWLTRLLREEQVFLASHSP